MFASTASALSRSTRELPGARACVPLRLEQPASGLDAVVASPAAARVLGAGSTRTAPARCPRRPRLRNRRPAGTPPTTAADPAKGLRSGDAATPDGRWKPLKTCDQPELPVGVVAAEALVAAVARKRNRDVLAHRAANRVDGEDRGVGERLADLAEDAR